MVKDKSRIKEEKPSLMSQYVKLLKKQIDKLGDESFDLEAWKTGTITVLHRIFSEDDTRARQIENLKIDYSSWALRDSNSNYKPIETAKLKGKEILRTAIDEIEIFGVPEKNFVEAIGNDLAEKLKTMSDAKRKKYFEEMKKSELVSLLQKLTIHPKIPDNSM